MPLGAKAKRLAHPFARLRAYFRKQLVRWREVSRSVKAAETRSRAEIHRIAIHEAGHAVLQIALDLDCKAVSICPIPREGIAGFTVDGSSEPPPVLADKDKDAATAQRTIAERGAYYLRRAMVSYAGAEAVRQLIPADPDPDAGASADGRHATEHITQHIGSSNESTELLFSLAKRRCALLVTHHQAEIEALAGALEAKLILSGRAARKAFMRSLAERSGRLMTFKTDPFLNGVDDDVAFRAFLRRINFPE